MTAPSAICLYCLRDHGPQKLCPYCGTAAGLVHYEYPQLAPGTMLHQKYLVGRTLGQGGFAITYLGLQVDLNRRVAIKEYMPVDLAERREQTGVVAPRRDVTARTDFNDCFDRGLQRFIEEGRHIVQCHHPAPHPNIVRVTDYFQTNGTAYLVMDFVEGTSLEAYLKRQPGGRINATDAVQIILPVLDGLRTVHQRGFFHRDVKPANVYLSNDGPVILLDFGSARLQLREETNTMTITLTPGYAPPEQYSSKGLQGTWTDVYGCAATLYRCISGVEPVSAMDRMAGMPLAPLSELAGTGVSPALDHIIMAGLAPDRTQRPQTVEEFQQALLAETRGAAPAGVSVKRTPKRKPVRRRRRMPAMLLALVLLTAASLVAGYLYANYMDQTRMNAAESAVNRWLASADPEMLAGYAPTPYREAERLSAAGERLRDTDPRAAAARFEEALEIYRDAARQARGRLDEVTQLRDEVHTLSGSEAAIAAGQLARDDYRQAQAAFQDAMTAMEAHNPDAAVAGFNSAKGLFDQLLGQARQYREAREKAREDAMSARTSARRAQADDHAPQLWTAAVDIWEQAEEESHPERAADAYVEAKARFAAAEEAARDHQTARQERLREAQRSAERARSSADTDEVRRFARETRGQAQEKFDEAKNESDIERARSLFAASADLFSRAVDQAREGKRAAEAQERTERAAPREQVQPTPPPTPRTPPPAPRAPDPTGLMPQLPPRLDVGDVHTESAVFTYTVDSYPGSIYVWYVNGRRILRGRGENVLRFTMEPGDLHIRLALEHDGREYTSAEGRARVIPVAPLPYRILAGQTGTFDEGLPTGYRNYMWTVGGQNVSRERVLRYTFQTAGTVRLEGRASDPINPSPTTASYRRVIYNVEVQ